MIVARPVKVMTLCRYQLDIGEGVLHLVVSFLYSDTVCLM